MRVHFVGCRGVSMRRLMALAARAGDEVSGSDAADGGHDGRNVEGCDLVVYSGAVGPNNVELAAAREKGIPTLERSKYLGRVAAGYGRVIAVAGTHGKTTTTAMIAAALAERKPTVHLGGETVDPIPEGGRDLFVTEACEYRRSLLEIKPAVAVVLGAELDHTDCYPDVAEVREVFARFARGSTDSVIFNGDDERLAEVMPRGAVTFGTSEKCDYCAKNITLGERKTPSFDLFARGLYLGRAELPVPGRHNALNALAAAAVALGEGVPFSVVAEALKRFRGVVRRTEFLGRVRGAEVYTDYAHHPTEIRALIAALPVKNRLIVAFEPHTFTRTRDLMDGFRASFDGADEVIILPVYGSRENSGPVGSEALASAVGARVSTRLVSGYEELFGVLLGLMKEGDTVAFVGAGTIDGAAREFAAHCGSGVRASGAPGEPTCSPLPPREPLAR